MIIHIWHNSYTKWVYFLLFQVLIWAVIPSLNGSTMTNTKNVLRFSLILQYLPRLFLIFPLSSQIVKATGVVTETTWAGAAYNLMLYMLASHVSTNMISFQICIVLLFAVYELLFNSLLKSNTIWKISFLREIVYF